MTHDPYALLPQVPSFDVTSTDLTDDQPMPDDQRGYEANVSPQLAWSGFPAATRSFAVSMFDPDAPSPSGWWHWSVANLPVEVTSLERDAGRADGSGLPEGAVQLRHDGGPLGYYGAAPPPGHGVHRYITVVHAVDVEHLDITAETTPSKLATTLSRHSLGRATITTTAER